MNESEPEWYIMIRESHELTRLMLTPPQTHAGKIRHASHHVEHHCATVLIKRHGHKVSKEILYFQGLHLVECESGRE